MGRRGPTPRAASDRGADGSLSATRHHGGVETSGVIESAPRPPKHMAGQARKAWVELAAVCADGGILREADLTSLEAMAISLGSVREMQAILDVDGPIIPGRFGPVAHPGVALRDRSLADYARWAARFGLTPSDRVSLGLQVLKGGKEELELLGAGGIGPPPRLGGVRPISTDIE